jgi:ABC-type antimicrobial peptide transport system permease subunit
VELYRGVSRSGGSGRRGRVLARNPGHHRRLRSLAWYLARYQVYGSPRGRRRRRSRYELSAFMVLLATLIAVVLGAVGLYGFVSYLVGQRSAEIGIRMALGATERGIRWLVVREALATAAAGLAVGLAAAAALAGWTVSLLFEVSPLDPVSFAIAPLLLITVTLVASYLPADRAARVEPRTALHRME